MQVIWDPAKASEKFKKHRVHFSDAEAVLFDPMALTVDEQDVDGEQRFITVGFDATSKVLVVVYTYRGETIRLISARKATPSEMEEYEKRI